MTRGRPRSIAVASTACALVAAAVAGRLLMSTCGVHRPGAAPEEQRAAPTPAGPTLSASAPRRADDCQSTAAMQSLFRPGDRDFLPWVEWKYRYFLAELQLAACAREQLEQLLAARERLVHEAGESRAELDDIDRHVRGLVPSTDRAEEYDALRDSDAEQRRLDDYAHGIEHVAPLSDEQKRAVLSAKLRRKREFESALRDAGLDRASLPASLSASLSIDEQMQAQAAIQRALDRYRDDFLLDASELLGEEQLGYLSSYETTEFEREAERLQVANKAR